VNSLWPVEEKVRPVCPGYHLLRSVRGDLRAELGRLDEARAELECAASLTRNARERTLLLDRAAACATNGNRLVR
jgi:predicted RNA polymerase sigma factor